MSNLKSLAATIISPFLKSLYATVDGKSLIFTSIPLIWLYRSFEPVYLWAACDCETCGDTKNDLESDK